MRSQMWLSTRFVTDVACSLSSLSHGSLSLLSQAMSVLPEIAGVVEPRRCRRRQLSRTRAEPSKKVRIYEEIGARRRLPLCYPRNHMSFNNQTYIQALPTPLIEPLESRRLLAG